MAQAREAGDRLCWIWLTQAPRRIIRALSPASRARS